MNLLNKTIIGGLSTLMLVAAANAAYIDFSSSTFKSADNQKTFYTTVSGIDVQLVASNPVNALLSYSRNGIGINSEIEGNGWLFIDPIEDWQPNQVGGNNSSREILDINFLNGPVNLSQITLGELYDQSKLFGGLEVALYSINGGIENQITAPDVTFWNYISQTGIVTENKTINNVSRISFKSKPGNDVISNFTLKGLEVASVPVIIPEPAAVPEPGMISLLVAGIFALSGVNFFRRRK